MTAKIKCAILGSTGMLGSMVTRFLSQQPEYCLRPTERASLDVAQANIGILANVLSGCDYAINCIGIIKPRIDETNLVSVEQAIRVNALFPHCLAGAAQQVGCRIIQIATDCVYAGFDGPYDEFTPADATDVYGKTKSLGEVLSPWVANLRCSIIGPEPTDPPRPVCSLLNWFTAQSLNATVSGYSNHLWNGVTTLAFARLCHGLMSMDWDSTIQPPRHVVPADSVTKAELLALFAQIYNRQDIQIDVVDAPAAIDRTLSTLNEDGNMELWKAAGYNSPPYIQQMIEEMAAYR